jgi:hypothetical protein
MVTTAKSEGDILTRVIGPDRPGLSVDAARSLLSLAFDPEDVHVMNELSQKAQEGTLTAEEQEHLDNYERIGHLLAILQSKARLSLKNRAVT